MSKDLRDPRASQRSGGNMRQQRSGGTKQRGQSDRAGESLDSSSCQRSDSLSSSGDVQEKCGE